MSKQASANVNTGKRFAIWSLYTTAGIITIAGLGFCVYSIINQVELTVMQSSVPGAVFGAIISFLGVRYMLAVGKLRKEVYRPTSQFSFRGSNNN